MANIFFSVKSPLAWTLLLGFSGLTTEIKKKFVNRKEIYELLKTDITQLHKQTLDMTQQQPVLDLLNRKRKSLQPELRTKLQIFQQWKKVDLQLFLKLSAVIFPCSLGSFMFPKTSIGIMFTFALLTAMNYETDRYILSGGRYNSYLKKQYLPTQSQVLTYCGYASLGIFSLALLKLGLIKNYQKDAQRILKQWRQNQAKKK